MPLAFLCKQMMLKARMPTCATGTVVIDNNGENLGRFFCSGSVLEGMFKSISDQKDYVMTETDVNKLSEDMICETLLMLEQVTFEVSLAKKVVLSMSVVS